MTLSQPLMDERQGTIANTCSYDPLGNVTNSTGSAPNAFTFEGMSVDSHTGFYYSGSGYYDPASGQSFGCKDKGSVDPGEDNCREDENARCGGVCAVGGGTAGTWTADMLIRGSGGGPVQPTEFRPGEAELHYEWHGKAMGFADTAEYVDFAKWLLGQPTGG